MKLQCEICFFFTFQHLNKQLITCHVHCRLGFLIDFLSHAAIVGFMAGAAITIALQQLKGLLGIKHFTKKTDIVSVMRSVWGTVHDEVTDHGIKMLKLEPVMKY